MMSDEMNDRLEVNAFKELRFCRAVDLSRLMVLAEPNNSLTPCANYSHRFSTFIQ